MFPMEQAKSLGFRLLGLQVENLTSTNRSQYAISAETGVMVAKINPQSYLAEIGVKAGDVVRRINDFTIQNAADFERAVVKYRHKKSIIILLQRGDQGYYITADI